MLQTSTAGPYILPENISGAAYTGEPHCVLRLHSPKNTLLEPKSEKSKTYFSATLPDKHQMIISTTCIHFSLTKMPLFCFKNHYTKATVH